MAQSQKTGGRKAGVPNKVNIATRERIENDADPVGFLCRVVNGEAIETGALGDDGTPITVRPTLDQRLSAAHGLTKKIIPDARDRPVRFSIPAITTMPDALKAFVAVLEGVASGDLTPSEGQQLANIVESYRKSVETTELEKRLSALEQRQGIAQ
jgi:hypothetical protein